MLQNIKLKKLIAIITLTAVVFVMLFSNIYIAQHKDHECTGVDCPVCALIDQCENNYKNIGTIIVAFTTTIFFFLSTQKFIQFIMIVCSCYNLIYQKVRMNN